VTEVAAWLDDRKISADDLKDGEPPGTTYGMRFRKNLRIAEILPRSITDILRQHLDKLRGYTDPTAYADLILGLLYLRQKYPARWEKLTASAVSKLRESAEDAITADKPMLTYLGHAISAILSETGGQGRLADIIRFLDSVLPPGDQGGASSESAWAGEVFEQLLELFANTQGKRAVVYTPRSVVRVLVELVSPQPGESVLDPCCESGGFLIDAARCVGERGGDRGSVSLVGQAPQERSWSLATMNLALHGLSADLTAQPGLGSAQDMYHRQFDVILANPPFNRDWAPSDAGDPRWRYGIPPESNANFAWLQHVVWSLSDRGRAAVIMPSGASSTGHEHKIRAAMTEDGVIEAVIALPPHLFASTAVAVNVWLLRRRDRGAADEILFIDARALGRMVSRSQRELSSEDIVRIVTKMQVWLRRTEGRGFENEPGFAASVPISTIRDNDYVLLPGRYVGVADHTPVGLAQVDELRRRLDRLHARSAEADAAVDRQLDRLGLCTH